MNRTKLLALLCALLLPAFLYAQDGSGGAVPIKLNGGFKLGANMARLDGKTWESGYKTNLLGGVFLGVHGNRFGIQVEGLFSQSEYRTGKDFNSLYRDYLSDAKDSLKQGAFRVNYLNIPVLLQYRLLNRVWLQAGPQFSGVVSTKDRNQLVRDAGELFKKEGYGNVSGVVGLWINLPFSLNIGGRYVMSFADENSTNVADSWKQRNVQLHIGYNF